MKELSKENIKQSKKYSFANIANEYDQFFTKIMGE